MKGNYRFVLFLPFLIFGAGVWLFFQTENEVRVQMARAQAKWRNGAYEEAIHLYEAVSSQYPGSRYADDALWEVATIYYFNYYDINRALSGFQRLVNRYPGTPLAKESHLKMAEINEAAFNDPTAAIAHWKQALAADPSLRSRRLIDLKIGNALLQMDRFDDARRQFEVILRDGLEDHVSDQASLRVGTIFQIKREYKGSLWFFEQVLSRSECNDCRAQAKLALIESYEFMDDLPKAIEIAQSIKLAEYPDPLKRSVLKRLTDKMKYYGQ